MSVLDDLDEPARQEAFERLQRRLPAVWRGMQQDLDDESVVVVPSMSAAKVGDPRAAALTQALEERYLFMLLLLRQPRLRMVYLTSVPVDPLVVEYYLGLLPGVIPSHARARVHFVAVGDSSPEPLTAKLLARPRLLQQVRDLVPDRSRCHLVPYTTSRLERDLALQLGIPVFGPDPRHLPLGTKTGCRRLFAAAGVRYPAGAEGLRTLDDVVPALARLHADRPDAEAAMVKLDEGAAGSGNAQVDLRGLPAGDDDDVRAAVRERVRRMQLESAELTVEDFLARMAGSQGVVEERVAGEDLRSPSVQLRITPLGEVEVLSTHDQVLGGPTGQSYLGARFPADPGYAALITRDAERIGQVLADEGVLGRFAVDFVVARHDGGWRCDAIEVNLRRGGTTHPFLTLQFLTDGRYDAATARFLTPTGAARHLVATDHLEDPRLRGLRPVDLFDLVARTGLHFDQSRQCGVVFHMISALTGCGLLGLTAIGRTAPEAQQLYEDARRALEVEARAALDALPLPG